MRFASEWPSRRRTAIGSPARAGRRAVRRPLWDEKDDTAEFESPQPGSARRCRKVALADMNTIRADRYRRLHIIIDDEWHACSGQR